MATGDSTNLVTVAPFQIPFNWKIPFAGSLGMIPQVRYRVTVKTGNLTESQLKVCSCAMRDLQPVVLCTFHGVFLGTQLLKFMQLRHFDGVYALKAITRFVRVLFPKDAIVYVSAVVRCSLTFKDRWAVPH